MTSQYIKVTEIKPRQVTRRLKNSVSCGREELLLVNQTLKEKGIKRSSEEDLMASDGEVADCNQLNSPPFILPLVGAKCAKVATSET